MVAGFGGTTPDGSCEMNADPVWGCYYTGMTADGPTSIVMRFSFPDDPDVNAPLLMEQARTQFFATAGEAEPGILTVTTTNNDTPKGAMRRDESSYLAEADR